MSSIVRIALVIVTLTVIGNVSARPELTAADIEELTWHVTSKNTAQTTSTMSRAASEISSRAAADLTDEQATAYWQNKAQAALKTKSQQKQNTNKAKNVIMFLGDGMSIPTLMAARTYLGQLQGKTGEESELHWESFPYTGLSKPYCVDAQTADSACSATAYLCGIKANDGTIGVNARIPYGDCPAMTNTTNHVSSIAEWALNSGKSSGIVTTARVTHASPAGAYARTANRDWEYDAEVTADGYDPTVCQDIATQLITTYPGKDFNVILGGGRRAFIPSTVVDDEGDSGRREDNVNLIDVWKQDKADRESSYSYVWNRKGLRQIIDSPEDVDYVLGLFESGHCQYHAESVAETEPTLAEMTEAAIKILEKNSNGYFLFVEGGRIDHAHHNNYANLAVDETVELASAVRVADELTSESDTLIVVTSDHAHVMSVSGYPLRGNDILGIGGTGSDSIPYTTLSYANGPGYVAPTDNTRYDVSDDDLTELKYQFPAMVPLSSETHGADDVAIFARGPWSHLFTGTMEQNNIPHYMAYAACVGEGLTACTV